MRSARTVEHLPTLAVSALGVVGAVAVLAAAAPPPTPNAPILALAPPWRDAGSLVEAAGGRPLGPTGAPLATLAVADDAATLRAIRAAGVWLIDGRAVARWCGVGR